MATASRKQTPVLFIGLFFGLLLGSAAAVMLGSSDTSETYRAYQERMARESKGGGGQAAPTRSPHGGGESADPHGGGAPQDRAAASQAKAHFMKKFVAALRSTPQNQKPNPRWQSPLREGAEPLDCADCHNPQSFNIEGMRASDPGAEAVEPFRRDPNFMIPLMRNWVKRLNTLHGDRLREPVSCITCHEKNPETEYLTPDQRQARAMAYAYFMSTFVKALSDKPTAMREPAESWKPLLKDPEGAPVRCSTCHTEPAIAGMDAMAKADLPRPERLAQNTPWVAELMELWVEKLNRKADGQLTKVVTCLDCHDRDPRR